MKTRARILKALISLAFAVFLLTFVGTRDLVLILKSIDPIFFALSLLLAVVMVLSSIAKWHVCVRLIRARLGFARLGSFYLIGYYFSNLLPSNVGGDVVRSYYLGRAIGSQSRAAASVFIERMSGILFLLLLGVTAPLFRPRLYLSPYIAIPSAGALALLGLLLALAALPEPVPRLRRLFSGRRSAGSASRPLRLLNRLLDGMDRVHGNIVQALRLARRDMAVIAGLAGLTVLFYIMTWMNVYLACRTFGAHPGFFDVAAVTPIIMLVSMVPISLGSLGLAEGAYVFYFSLIGMNPAVALAVGLFMRFKLVLVGILGFACFLGHRHDADRIPSEPLRADGSFPD